MAFQYPDAVARLVRDPLGYFLSRGQKKNHSISLLGRNDLSTDEKIQVGQYENSPEKIRQPSKVTILMDEQEIYEFFDCVSCAVYECNVIDLYCNT